MRLEQGCILCFQKLLSKQTITVEYLFRIAIAKHKEKLHIYL